MRIGAIAFGISSLLMAECAAAQTTQPLPPLLPPLLTDPAMGPVRQQSVQPLQPEVFPQDFNPDGNYVAPATQPVSYLREGTYFLRQAGRFGRGGTDGQQWIFTPDPSPNAPPGSPPPTPIVVLPSRNRSSMEQQIVAPATEVRLSLSGTITLYKMQNYLLVEIAAPTGAAATEPVLAAQKSSPTTRSAISATMPASEVLDQMLKPPADAPARPIRPQGTGPAPNDSTSGAAAVGPGAPQLTVMREGTFLVDRTGRLTRSADGQNWEFTFESDGRSMKDPPVVILPNLKLMTMEQAVKSANRDLRFRITGMVTEYNGRNYVLLEKIVVPPETTQQF